jgi:outer membrane murein-binding lipoprotein Lpp
MIKQMLMTPAVFGLALLSGQSSTTIAPRPSSLEDVVAEVRALRGDLHQMAESSLRAQLLVARLQVEEQRIDGLAKQLSDTEQQMRALESAKNPMLTQMLKNFEAEPREPGEPDVFAGVRAQLEKIENGDPVLQERHASLTRMLTEEQGRWAAFNAQLEALERGIVEREKGQGKREKER